MPNPHRNVIALPKPRRKPRAGGVSEAGATERIAESITTAIIERRLMPGTRLAEQKLADLFSVSRTIVRQALIRLSRDHLVTLEPARGARVAEPGVEEARQVFEVRRILELALVRRLAASITAAQIAELRVHLGAEHASVRHRDVSGRTRLLGDFHLVLARMLGNHALTELLAELLSRCSLIALMHPPSQPADHAHGEHAAIVDALERRDARAVQRLMEEHLQHVERELKLEARGRDLGAALFPAG